MNPDGDTYRPVFGLSGIEWDLEKRGGKWLVATAGNRTEEKQRFLSFVKQKPMDPSAKTVILKKETDESCFWELEIEGEASDLSLNRCFLKATDGDFRGWYLTVGDPLETKNGVVLSRVIMLRKEKSAKGRLKIWIDGK